MSVRMKALRALDVCGGAGGWATAARGLPIRIVAAIDHAEDCLATYRSNHPKVETCLADVTTFDFSRFVGKIDIILGGIPCEEISAARRCRPLSDEDRERWLKLLRVFLDLPEMLRAPLWCYEDVRDILRFIPDNTPHFTIDSQYFSGQRRIRAFIGNVPPPLKFDLDPRVFGTAIRPGPYRCNPRLLERRPGRSAVYGGGRGGEKTKMFYPWEVDEKSPTVISLCGRHDNFAAARCRSGWRQLEWQELAILQGFPPDYLFLGSASRVTKMVAQAVQIDTARAILTEAIACKQKEAA